jgi:hypothetical protein
MRVKFFQLAKFFYLNLNFIYIYNNRFITEIRETRTLIQKFELGQTN